MSACQTCAAEQPTSTRYCAPLRCYCGHPTCPAFASYEAPTRLNVTSLPTRATSTAWDDREESTWIDSM